MRTLRAGLFGLLVVAAVSLDVEVRQAGAPLGVRAAVAATESEGVMSRAGKWTRARLQAAKIRWAEHERWFSECNREMESLKKSGTRWSYDRQARFLEQCMRRKH